MIRWVRGNLFDSKAEALVNTVNCVGIMGKGIAYQFKRAYPDMFKDYERRCRAGQVRLGQVTEYPVGDGRLIINFPTKDHWKAHSRLEDIQAGLLSLRVLIQEHSIKSVALPPLGCGNGGLHWPDVRQQIEDVLGVLTDVLIEGYEPVGDFDSKVAKEPRLSLGHYVLIGLRLRLARPTKLNLQKGAYFFNVVLGEDYFAFVQHKMGPYCIGIDPMSRAIKEYKDFTGLEGDALLVDGLNRKLPGTDADKLRSWLPHIKRVAEICSVPDKQIEAMATAHAILATKSPLSFDDLRDRFYAWSEEKRKFTSGDILRSLTDLETEGLIRSTLLGFEIISTQKAGQAKKCAPLPDGMHR